MCEEWSRKNFSNSPQKLEKRQFGEKEKKIYYCTNKTLHMGKKQASGAQKRRKKKEKEKAVERMRAEVERLKLGPTKLWTGLVLHHKDVFVSHVISKLNGTDRFFFSEVSRESRGVLAYAGVNVSKLHGAVWEFTSISTLEWKWNNMDWGEKDRDGDVIDQVRFCAGVAATNKLELLKWAREVKDCEWGEWTIKMAASKGNLEILKYCFSNGCAVMKKSHAFKLRLEDTSTVFDFFSTKCNLREIRREKRHDKQHAVVTWTS